MPMSGRWQAVAIGVPLFLLFHGAAITIEEKMLLKLFGQMYADYARAVPRLLPRHLPAAGGGPAPRTFSWERVLYNREPFNVIGVVILALLFGLRLALHRLGVAGARSPGRDPMPEDPGPSTRRKQWVKCG